MDMSSVVCTSLQSKQQWDSFNPNKIKEITFATCPWNFPTIQMRWETALCRLRIGQDWWIESLNMEQDIPIDIHVGKLVDWLVSRRHCKKDWPDAIQQIREKINSAISDMPENEEITRLLTGTYINYYHCLRIVEILKETEKDTKNILGWYGSQRMKDWQEIVKLYERDHVFLAEAGQLLIRNVNFEIPAMKRQITKGVQVQQECERKELECTKGQDDAKKKYSQMCKKMGIEGDKIKHELVDLLKTLPEELDTIAENTKTLSEACKLYTDFVTFIVGGSEDEGMSQIECVPLVQFIIANGNVTTYEWIYGEPPCKIEEPKIDIILEDESNEVADEGIDFGNPEVDNNEIDFGPELTTGEIDWGNLTTEDSGAIDWGIGECDVTTDDIVIEESGQSGGVARDSEAMSLLYNPKTKGQFVDELHELEGFLKQRTLELQNEGSFVAMNQFSNAPSSIQGQSLENIESMLTEVKKIISLISTTKLQQLFLISSSPRYVDRLSDSLRSKLSIVDKLESSKEAIRERKDHVVQEQRLITPKLSVIVDRTKELQNQIEDSLSKRYKGRPVNLMGTNLST